MLTKFYDKLPLPKRLRPTARAQDRASYYLIEMRPVVVHLHGELPPTTLWGFNGHFPGPTIETRVGSPALVTWLNQLPGPHPIRPLLRSAPEVQTRGGETAGRLELEPIPIWTNIHLHGGQTPPDSDGMPVNAFFPRQSVTCTYPNRQRSATLWYHDNAFGQNRVNMYAGLFGAYLLRDDEEDALGLPAGDYELPLLLHDLDLEVGSDGHYTGALAYQLIRDHDEFYGSFNAVNGKIWPYVDAEPRQYRLRIINAALGRFYRLSLRDGSKLLSGCWRLIGTDSGLLHKPLEIPQSGLVLGPGERADIVVDFRTLAGRQVLLYNDAPAPYPNGDTVVPTNDGEVLQFRIAVGEVADSFVLPEVLVQRRRLERHQAQRTRSFRLNAPPRLTDVAESRSFFRHIDIMPELDSTEIWEIQNPYHETSILHVHLAQMQILDRRLNGDQSTDSLAIGEQGWKDTIRLPPHACTRILVRFSEHTGLYVYRYRTSEADNDMPRPLLVVPQGKSQ